MVENIILQKGKRADEVNAGEALSAFEKLWNNLR
jgi:hypothetical protein